MKTTTELWNQTKDIMYKAKKMATTELHINQMYFRVLPCSSKDGDYWESVKNGNWEPETFEFMRRHIEPTKDYLELGGWIGSTAMMAYSLNPRKIYSIEADPANYQTLKYNINNNCMQDKVHIFNACLVDHINAGKIIPFGTANDDKPNSSSHRLDNGSRIKVIGKEATSFLNKNCNMDKVNCANIDIEGSEVLMTDLFNQLLHKDISILLSLHPGFWRNFKESEAKIADSISKWHLISPFDYKKLQLSDVRNRLYKKEFFPIIMKSR